jgi:hypothetical protein
MHSVGGGALTTALRSYTIELESGLTSRGGNGVTVTVTAGPRQIK